MSNQSKFPGFKKSPKLKAVTQAPREMKEIDEECSKLVNRAGQIQYQIFALKQEQDHVNNNLIRITQEAEARNALDKAAEPVEAKND